MPAAFENLFVAIIWVTYIATIALGICGIIFIYSLWGVLAACVGSVLLGIFAIFFILLSIYG